MPDRTLRQNSENGEEAVLEGMKTEDFPEFIKYMKLPRSPSPEF